MEQQIAEFRRQLEAEFGGWPGRGARYSEALQARGLALVQEGLARGATLRAMVRQLGLRMETVRRWQAAEPVGGRELRPVEIVLEGGVGPTRNAGAGLVLISANGHRVEGLALAQVAQLLEVLG